MSRCRALADFLEASAFSFATEVPAGWPSEGAHDRTQAAHNASVRSTRGYEGGGVQRGAERVDGARGACLLAWGMHAVAEWQHAVGQAACHAVALAMARGAGSACFPLSRIF